MSIHVESEEVNAFIREKNIKYAKAEPNRGKYLNPPLHGMTTKQIIGFVYGQVPSDIEAIKLLKNGRILVHAVSRNILHTICQPIPDATAQSLEYHMGVLLKSGKVSRLPACIHKPNGHRQNAFVYVQYGHETDIDFVEEPDEKAKRTTRTRRAAKTRQILGRSSTGSKHSTVIGAVMDILPSTVPESMVISEDVPGTTRFCYKTLGVPASSKRETGTYYSPISNILCRYKQWGKIQSVNRIMKTENGARIVSVYYTGYAVQKEYSDESLRNMLQLMRKE